MKTLTTIILTIVLWGLIPASAGMYAQDKKEAAPETFTAFDSVRVADLQQEIKNLEMLNTQNEQKFSENFRAYKELKEDILKFYTKAQNQLNALLEKKKQPEKKENDKRR